MSHARDLANCDEKAQEMSKIPGRVLLMQAAHGIDVLQRRATTEHHFSRKFVHENPNVRGDVDIAAYEIKNFRKITFGDIDDPDPSMAELVARSKKRAHKEAVIAAKTRPEWMYSDISAKIIRIAFPFAAYLRCLWILLELPMHSAFNIQVRNFITSTVTLRNLVALGLQIQDPSVANVGPKLCAVLRIALEGDYQCCLGSVDFKKVVNLDVVSKWLVHVYGVLEEHGEMHISGHSSEQCYAIRYLYHEAVLLTNIVVKKVVAMKYEVLSRDINVQREAKQACIDRLVPKTIREGLCKVLTMDPNARKPIHSITKSRKNLEHNRVDQRFSMSELSLARLRILALEILGSITHNHPGLSFDIYEQLCCHQVVTAPNMHSKQLHMFAEATRRLRFRDCCREFIFEESSVLKDPRYKHNKEILFISHVSHYDKYDLSAFPTRRLLLCTAHHLILLNVPADDYLSADSCSIEYQRPYTEISRLIEGHGRQFFAVGWSEEGDPCYEMVDLFIVEEYYQRDVLLHTIQQRSGPTREVRVERQHDAVFMDALRSALGPQHLPAATIFIRGGEHEDSKSYAGQPAHPRLLVITDLAIWEFEYDLSYWTIPPDGSGHGIWGDGIHEDAFEEPGDSIAGLDGDVNLRDGDEDHQHMHRTRIKHGKKWTATFDPIRGRAEKELQKDLNDNWRDFDVEGVMARRHEATTWTRAIGHFGPRMEKLANSQRDLDLQGNDSEDEPEYQAGLIEKAIDQARHQMLHPVKRVPFDQLQGITFGPVDVPDAVVEYEDPVSGPSTIPIEFYDEHSRDEFRTVLATVFSSKDSGSNWNRGHHWVPVKDPSDKSPDLQGWFPSFDDALNLGS